MTDTTDPTPNGEADGAAVAAAAAAGTKSWSLDMPLEEAMMTQRAIRRLKPDPVDDGLILRLIELGQKAPTGSNQQNWEFVVVKDRETKAKIGRMNMQAWRIYGGIGRRTIARKDPKLLRIIDAVQHQADNFADVPVVLVACLRGPRPHFPPVLATGYYGSIYPSVQNILLGARAAGLGAALITLPLWSTFLFKRILDMPWSVTPCAVIPMGWPTGRYGPTTRRPVGDVTSLDRYGNRPWKEGAGVSPGVAAGS